jgi:hypothetical protein
VENSSAALAPLFFAGFFPALARRFLSGCPALGFATDLAQEAGAFAPDPFIGQHRITEWASRDVASFAYDVLVLERCRLLVFEDRYGDFQVELSMLAKGWICTSCTLSIFLPANKYFQA